MRSEFLQAMQAMCREGDALFVLDEVQTGVGLTGTAWAYQQLGLEPDIVAFAKKVQLGGIMAGLRVDEVVDNVFAVPGRINSTWGGGLADMVRSRRLLEIIDRDGLIEHAAQVGDWLLGELVALGERHADVASNVRGRGLMCVFDLPDARVRRRGAAAAAGGACSCAAVRRALDPVPAGAGRHRAGARVRAGRAGPRPDHPGPLTNKGCYRWISAPSPP